MTDRPIIFSAPMVRALLGGRKTQTRRIIRGTRADALSRGFVGIRLPYAPGDRLWVREAVRAEELSRPPVRRAATAKERRALGRTHVAVFDDLDGADGVRYIADDEWRKIENSQQAAEAWSTLYHYAGRGHDGIGTRVPALHMPRWASRITLTVTDVRVQRVQEISEEEAKAEGVEPVHEPDERKWQHYAPHAVAFSNLWNSIHGPGAWEKNPWVCAITFTVQHRNIDQ